MVIRAQCQIKMLLHEPVRVFSYVKFDFRASLYHTF